MQHGGEMTLFRRRNKVRPLFLLLLAAFIIIGGFMLVEFILKNTLFALAEAEAKWRATEAIHEAILEEVGTDTQYEDIVHIEKDAQNRIIFMQANIIKINKLTSGVVLNIEGNLKELRTKEFRIPLGQLTDNMLLANYGPHIKFLLVPVATQVYHTFEEAGINQTRHKIYLNVKSKIKIAIPFFDSVINVTTKVPIADAVIVGEVPETYLNISAGDAQGLISQSIFKKPVE